MKVFERDSMDFIPINEYEKDYILNRLSDDILTDNLKEQINTKLLDAIVKNDLLVIFNTRYNFIQNQYREYDEVIKSCRTIKLNLYTDILLDIQEKFNFSTNLEDKQGTDDYYLYIEGIYKFFILNYYDNLIRLIITYILDHKKDLISEFEEESDKKDLMFRSLKKIYKDNEDIHIIYNLDKIVDFIINLLHDSPTKILDIIIEDNKYKFDNKIIHDIFLVDNDVNADIGASFSSIYLTPLRLDRYRFKLLSDIRNELNSLFIEE